MALRFYIIVALLFLINTGCKDVVKQPTFVKTEDTRITGLNLTNGTAKLTTKLVFKNENSFGVEAKDAQMKLYVEGAYVADITQPQLIKVEANQDFSIPLSAQINLQKTLGSVIGMLGKKSIAYKVEGTVKVGKKGVFVSVPVKVEDQYKLEI
jgi:LEA14-like dessication related protein